MLYSSLSCSECNFRKLFSRCIGISNVVVGATCFFLLSGCFWKTPTVPVNLDFVESSYGYLNAGSFRAGTLFIWKRESEQDVGSLFFVTNLQGFNPPARNRLREIDFANYQRGAEIGIGASLGLKEGDIDAEVSNRVKFRLTNFIRHKSDNYKTKIARHIKFDLSQNQNPPALRPQSEKDDIMEVWKFRDIEMDKNSYYVLVTDVTYGDSVMLEVDKKIKTTAQFVVPIQQGGKVRIDLQNKSGRLLQGEFIELMFSVDVLTPVWKTNDDGGKNPDFEIVTDKVFPDMPKLLREMNKPNFQL